MGITEMIEHIVLATFVGLFGGILVGLVPGIGVSTATLVMAPALLLVDPLAALFFFVAMQTTSQYFGSIPSLVYGVPGEINDYPIIQERKHLLNKIEDALKQTALGSLIGSVIALLAFLICMYTGNFWVYLYNYKIMAWILGIAALSVVIFGSGTNNKIVNALLLVIGFFLGKIGYDEGTTETFGMFGIDDLSTGIPILPLALGLLMIPNLVDLCKQKYQISPAAPGTLLHSAIEWASIVRGTFFGIIGGMVPGVTYMASTQLSYFIENKIKQHSENRPMQSVVSSSTADNAGAVSSLYTLIWLGIPITLGEALIVYLYQKKAMTLNWDTFQNSIAVGPWQPSVFSIFIIMFLIVNVMAYLLSWPGRQVSIKLARTLLTPRTSLVILGIVAISILFAALESYSVPIFFMTLAIASIVGLVMKTDWVPLVIGFILQDNIQIVLYKIGILTY